MSSSDDEDDKFLYGSDTEGGSITAVDSKRKRGNEDNQGVLNKKPKIANSAPTDGLEDESGSSNDTSAADDSDSESSESESDSDVEFIISTGADTTRLDSTLSSGTNTGTATQPSGITVATAPTETPTDTMDDGTTVVKSDTAATAAVHTLNSIDLNAEGIFEGEPITSLDPEVLKEKPWRQPGANLSDYFNYGFNEFTWLEYLNKQEKLQQDYNPHKILMGLLTLQQQGKLNGPKTMDSLNSNTGDNSNPGSVNNNSTINLHAPNRPMPPPGFPPLPMFGGFSPFGMPGMMPPMNQQNQNQKK